MSSTNYVYRIESFYFGFTFLVVVEYLLLALLVHLVDSLVILFVQVKSFDFVHVFYGQFLLFQIAVQLFYLDFFKSH